MKKEAFHTFDWGVIRRWEIQTEWQLELEARNLKVHQRWQGCRRTLKSTASRPYAQARRYYPWLRGLLRRE
jgi:hypothetical protein